MTRKYAHRKPVVDTNDIGAAYLPDTKEIKQAKKVLREKRGDRERDDDEYEGDQNYD